MVVFTLSSRFLLNIVRSSGHLNALARSPRPRMPRTHSSQKLCPHGSVTGDVPSPSLQKSRRHTTQRRSSRSFCRMHATPGDAGARGDAAAAAYEFGGGVRFGVASASRAGRDDAAALGGGASKEAAPRDDDDDRGDDDAPVGVIVADERARFGVRAGEAETTWRRSFSSRRLFCAAPPRIWRRRWRGSSRPRSGSSPRCSARRASRPPPKAPRRTSRGRPPRRSAARCSRRRWAWRRPDPRRGVTRERRRRARRRRRGGARRRRGGRARASRG